MASWTTSRVLSLFLGTTCRGFAVDVQVTRQNRYPTWVALLNGNMDIFTCGDPGGLSLTQGRFTCMLRVLTNTFDQAMPRMKCPFHGSGYGGFGRGLLRKNRLCPQTNKESIWANSNH